MIKSINDLDLNKRYSYQDYLTWQFEEMVELIKGKIFKMSPAPNVSHQRVAGNLFKEIATYVEGKKCEVFFAPFDVRLPAQNKDDKIVTVVQPDICVICDLSKLDHQGCLGAPEWVIEILSKSTARKDLHDKFELYQNSGVEEYWIVHPDVGTVIVYRLDETGLFQPIQKKPFTAIDAIPVGVFPGYEMSLSAIFP